MIDKGASEAEIDQYLAGEGVRAQDLHGARMSAEDEAGYQAIAKDPNSTADDLVAYVASKGFTLDPATAQAFVEQRSAAGGRAGDGVTYTDDLPAPPSQDQGPPSEDTLYDPSKDPHAQLQGPEETPNPENSTFDSIHAGMGRFLNGAFPGSARSLAGLRGMIDNGVSATFGRSKFDPNAAYEDYADESDREIANFDRDHPTLGDTAGWAGFGTSMFLPAAKVAKGENLLAGTINGAINGAGYGTLGGLMNDSGEGRIANAENGFLFGGALGSVLPGGFSLGAKGADWTRRTVPFLDRTITGAGNLGRRAAGLPIAPPNLRARAQGERLAAGEMENGRISQGMGVDGPQSTPANVEAEVARRQAMGVPAMPADTTDDLRRLTAWALQGRGPMTSRARSALSSRQAGAGGRVRQHVQAELGPAVDPIAEVEAINERAKNAARPLYEKAYEQPLQITPEMVRISKTPAFQDALPVATRNIENDLGDPRAMGFIMDADGNVARGPVKDISTEGLDQTIRAMRDNGRAAADLHPVTGRVVNNTNSIGINARAADLRNALAAQNPHYAEAIGMYADEMAVREAMERGGDIASLSGPEIEAHLRTTPQANAREAYTAGARTSLADAATDRSLKSTANVPQVVRQALGLPGAGLNAAGGDVAKLQAIETMSNRPGVVRRLDDRLEGEDQAFKTFSEAFGNSKTAGRKAYDESVTEAGGMDTARKAMTGQLIGATVDLLFRGRGAGRFKQDVQERIAELLTAQEPRDVSEAMAAIARRAQTDRAFAASLHRAGIKLGQISSIQAAGMPTEHGDDIVGEDPELGSDQPQPPALPVYTRRN